ncbi:MAG: D-alanyl-D-alanine carboxypeptidase [Clostridiales bacterium]|nr:D-alanyl-D-alanine carboxypeptidase [Clostridiales bacterium]
MKLKKLLSIALGTLIAFNLSITAFAGGTDVTDETNDAVEATAETLQSECTAKSVIMMEAKTGTTIFEIEGEKSVPMSHLAKLMTMLIVAEEVDAQRLKLDEKLTVSANANSQGGTQIWLNVGETISVLELLKAITIGNANDACMVLAEKIGGSEQEFISMMNQKAVELGMERTHFEDVTGMSDGTISTARDIGILAVEITKYEFINEYTCTWMDYVRGEQVELVNTNRLIRSYNGITGMKACSSDTAGNCLVATAKRGEMTLICVILDSQTKDTRFDEGKKILNHGFAAYELYTPKLSKEIMSKVSVHNGKELKVSLKAEKEATIIIPKGSSSNIKVVFEKEEVLQAPVKAGSKVGYVRLVDPEGVIFESDLVAEKKVEKMTFGTAFKRLWTNMLKLC